MEFYDKMVFTQEISLFKITDQRDDQPAERIVTRLSERVKNNFLEKML